MGARPGASEYLTPERHGWTNLYGPDELPVFILAPKLRSAVPPVLSKRKIFWSSEAKPTASLVVLSADVETVTSAVMNRDADAVAQGAPDLQLVFSALAHMEKKASPGQARAA